MMDEFGLIKKYFAPLAKGFSGGLNLSDDAALIDTPKGQQMVITKDAICEGIHFIGDEAPALIAKKLLRVNLSDLAAKGATAHCYFLAIMLPKNTEEKWLEEFAAGLAEDQKEFSIHLAGGDTTATKGGKYFSLTAMGYVPEGSALLRSGAQYSDDIYVSGTLGDSALGLRCLQGELPLSPRAKAERSLRSLDNARDDSEFLIGRYFLPQPRLTLGQELRGIATSCMDISDGLMQDLGHLCSASNVGANIYQQNIPLSDAAKTLQDTPNFWEQIVTGGDDYELLFTTPKTKANEIKDLAKKLDLPITRIGETNDSKQVYLLDGGDKEIEFTRKGYKHF